MASMKETIASLEPAIARLDAMDDRLLLLLRDVEGSLCRIVRTRISMAGPDGSEFAFGKHQGRWSFLWQIGDTTTPLCDCSREMRVSALVDGKIERLITGAADQIDAQIETRKAAIQHATRLIASLEGGK